MREEKLSHARAESFYNSAMSELNEQAMGDFYLVPMANAASGARDMGSGKALVFRGQIGWKDVELTWSYSGWV